MGLCGALLFVGGFAGHLALITPAYAYGDETTHVGYVLALRQGTLPSIDTPIPLGGDEVLEGRVEVASTRAPHQRNIYVANDPPLVHVLALPLAEVGSWLRVPSPALVALRLVDVVGGMVAVACSYLLARELAGRADLVGLAAAGLVSATMGLGLIVSLASLDGVALAATTGLTWSLARVARTRSPAGFLHLGLWAAVASAVRPMSAAYAAAAVVLALVIAWRSAGWRALPRLGLRVLGPAALLVGWFYALNQYRYGDPTGSAALFERLGRVGHVPLDAGLLSRMFGHLFRSTDVRFGLRNVLIDDIDLIAPAALAVVALAFAFVVTRGRVGQPIGRQRRPLPAAWMSVLVLAGVPFVLVIKHVSAGGSALPRYLLPTLPIVASAAALLLRQLGRWAPVVVVALVATLQLSRIEAAAALRRGLSGFFGGPLPPLVGSRLVVETTRLLVLLGGALLIIGLTALALRRREGKASTLLVTTRPEDTA